MVWNKGFFLSNVVCFTFFWFVVHFSEIFACFCRISCRFASCVALGLSRTSRTVFHSLPHYLSLKRVFNVVISRCVSVASVWNKDLGDGTELWPQAPVYTYSFLTFSFPVTCPPEGGAVVCLTCRGRLWQCSSACVLWRRCPEVKATPFGRVFCYRVSAWPHLHILICMTSFA